MPAPSTSPSVEGDDASTKSCIFCGRMAASKLRLLTCFCFSCETCIADELEKGGRVMCPRCKVTTDNNRLCPDFLSELKPKCIYCSKQSKLTCTVCNVNFCHNCRESHLSESETALPGFSSFKRESTYHSISELWLGVCECHRSTLKYYCKLCEKAFCSYQLEFSMCHKLRHDIELLEDAAKSKLRESAATTNNFLNLQNDIDLLNMSWISSLNYHKNSQVEKEIKIRQSFEKMSSLLFAMEQEFLQHFRNECATQLKSTEQNIQSINSVKSIISKAMGYTSRVQDQCSAASIIRLQNLLNKQYREFEKIIIQLKTWSPPEVKFAADLESLEKGMRSHVRNCMTIVTARENAIAPIGRPSSRKASRSPSPSPFLPTDSDLDQSSASTSSSRPATPYDMDVSLQMLAALATQQQPPVYDMGRMSFSYFLKIGEFGTGPQQFTEPNGVAVFPEGDIVVADTNNHRIQIFTIVDGKVLLKRLFGVMGKGDGQLLYPNRVAVNSQSREIIITERSPTHQVQVYSEFGDFVRKFGNDILEHPRGLTVDEAGNVIVVECKVMRIVVFDRLGNLVAKLDCKDKLDFPNSICARKGRLYVSDNRAHCVKVFDYFGKKLQEIGGPGVTNYPIGVGFTPSGQLLVADNHNNFNISVFDPITGQYCYGYESKVKHAQCFDIALTNDFSVIVSSKDYRLYVYKYCDGTIEQRIAVWMMQNKQSESSGKN